MPTATRARRRPTTSSTNGNDASAAPAPPTARKRSPAELNKELKEKFHFRFDIIPIEDMFVDHDSYQRPLTSFAKRIENNFKPWLIQTVAVSERSDGTYAVIDGQTRMVASEKLGFQALPALVFEGLTRAEEAEIFVLLGTERRSVTSTHRFRAALAAKNPQAIAINTLVNSVGLEIGSGVGQISAVKALEMCYRRDAVELERTLIDLKEAFPEITPPGDLIRGLHLFFTPRKAKERKVRALTDDKKLVRRLNVTGVETLRRRAGAAKEAEGKTSSAALYIAGAIAKIYDSK